MSDPLADAIDRGDKEAARQAVLDLPVLQQMIADLVFKGGKTLLQAGEIMHMDTPILVELFEELQVNLRHNIARIVEERK